jgi:hypothetical protein
MKTTIARNGYPVLKLTKEGRGRTLAVHVIVLTAFAGPKGTGQECRHLNGDPKDPRLSNLCWGTPLENTEDRQRHGTMPRGASHHAAKLSAEQVLEIRNLCASNRQIAAKYGVSPSVISNIKNQKAWAWL